MPKLSIITINFNNRHGLQKTIDSVMLQTQRDFEHIIIDGGSTDGSKELIEQHAGSFAYWISEKDNGIYAAMNKGMEKASGEYLFFLNSGDCFYGANTLRDCFSSGLTEDIVYGDLCVGDNKICVYPDQLSVIYFFYESIPHPASFIKRSLFDKYGRYNESHRIVSDWEFFVKAIINGNASYRHMNIIVTRFDTNGISNDESRLALHRSERLEVLVPLLKDKYPQIVNELMDINNELKNYRNSKMIRMVKKMISAKKYLSLRKMITGK